MASTNQVNTVTTENVVPVGATYDANGNFITLVGAAGAPINTLSGGGTANGVAYLNGSKVLTTGSALTFDGTNLGIGTSSPTQKLNVNGIGLFEGASQGNMIIQKTGTNGVSLFSDAAGKLGFYDQSAGITRLTLDSSGNLGIGTTSPSASAILDAQSTTKGVRMPNMTTTQKNAISSPAAGLMVFDTTLAKLCVYSGSAWQTITSV
jgi:hypothetical protein